MLRKKFFTQSVVRQRSCGCPILGGAQSQIRWCPGCAELVGGNSACSRAVGTE